MSQKQQSLGSAIPDTTYTCASQGDTKEEHFHSTRNANSKTKPTFLQSLSLSDDFSGSVYRVFNVFISGFDHTYLTLLIHRVKNEQANLLCVLPDQYLKVCLGVGCLLLTALSQ